MLHILCIGGTGFISSHVVLSLLKAKYHLTIITRGKTAKLDKFNQYNNQINFIYCNRDERKEFRKTLKKIKDKYNWFCIIDFICYEEYEIIDLIKSNVFLSNPLYIMISTDSIYQICNKKHINLWQEIDDKYLLPNLSSDELLNIDDYGYNKYLCEDIIKKNINNYLILRLPDVLGEYEIPSSRFYSLQYKLMNNIPIYMPLQCKKCSNNNTNEEKLCSFVYVQDIAKFIYYILHINNNKFINFQQIINFANTETISLTNFINNIWSNLNEIEKNIALKEQRLPNLYHKPLYYCKCTNKSSVIYQKVINYFNKIDQANNNSDSDDDSDDDDDIYMEYLPSVECGSISTKYLTHQYPLFKNTKLKDWIKYTTTWYYNHQYLMKKK